MRIFIDHREHGTQDHSDSRADRAFKYFETRLSHQSKNNDNSVDIIELPVGDYVFEKDDVSVVYEYKTFNDYFNSLYDGSLFEEVANQTLKHDYSFVIIEGYFYDYVKESWEYSSSYVDDDKEFNKYYNKTRGRFAGSLRRLRAMSCPILVPEEHLGFEEMYEQSLKCFSQKDKVYAGSKRAFINGDIMSLCLSGCSGVSDIIIKNVKETYNPSCLKDLLNLSLHDFEQVPLIGEKRARDIYEYLHQGE